VITISKIRSILYGSAKVLGDVQAIDKAVETQSPKPVVKRIGRRLAGKFTSRLLGQMFRW